MMKKETVKGETARERLLESGERLFSRCEFDQISIDDITAGAGMAHGLLFHYFKSKMSFYAEISRRAAARLSDVHHEPRAERTADEKLAACLSRHLDFMSTRPAAFKFHARGSISAEVRQIWEESRREFILMILKDFYAVSAPPDHLIAALRAWLGFFDELVLAWINDPRIKRSGVLGISIELFREIMRHSQLLRVDEELDAARTARPRPRRA